MPIILAACPEESTSFSKRYAAISILKVFSSTEFGNLISIVFIMIKIIEFLHFVIKPHIARGITLIQDFYNSCTASTCQQEKEDHIDFIREFVIKKTSILPVSPYLVKIFLIEPVSSLKSQISNLMSQILCLKSHTCLPYGRSQISSLQKENINPPRIALSPYRKNHLPLESNFRSRPQVPFGPLCQNLPTILLHHFQD